MSEAAEQDEHVKFGLKDIADREKVAAKHGLELKEKIEMPSNNFPLCTNAKRF